MIDRAEAFGRWLGRRGYRPRTVDKTVSDLQSYLRNHSIVKAARTAARWKDYERAYRMYKEYASEEGFRVPAPHPETVAKPPKEMRHEKKRRKMPALSIDEAEWKKLRKAVVKDELPESRVLEVMMATGLRVGDVLRVTPEELASALKRTDGLFTVELKGGKQVRYPLGGAEEEWRRLLREMQQEAHVAELVSGQRDPDDRAAYYKVREHFIALCEAVPISGRIHLHRLRRTVATRLLNRDVSLFDVQQLLGHSDPRTTQRYTDEWSAGRMTGALRKNRD